MLKNIFKFVSVLALILVSVNVAFAQPLPSNSIVPNGSYTGPTGYQNRPTQMCLGDGIGGVICKINQLLNAIIPILVLLGVVFFVYGVVMYMIADDEEAKTKGRDRIIYGIIGFAVIISLWGLVNLVVNTFNIGAQTVSIPSLVPTTTAGAGGDSCEWVDNPNLQNIVKYIICLIQNAFIPLLFAFAVGFFLFGVIQYVILADSEEAKTKGRDQMIWGIIALAVMLGVWGLVAIVGGTFGLETDVLPSVSPK